jgi:uncharacterized membrane protein
MAASSVAPRERVASVDLIRGAIMVIMALDHVRDFVSNQRYRPEDLTTADVWLFATRWITHYCAPTFFLLAGVGIGLALLRSKKPEDMSRYLAIRGFWLMVLDVTVGDFNFAFAFGWSPVFAVVLWTLGLSMICMAGLIRLPKNVVAVFSVVLIFAHNLLDGVRSASLPTALQPIWVFLHEPNFVIPGKFISSYPLIPWVGVMGLGYALASAYAWDAERRKKLFIGIGVTATLLFVALRATHSYGNPGVWTPQRSPDLTIAAFFNLQKYPPSLQFLGMTLGPVLVALALVENARGRIANIVAVYGKVPFFYYFGHFFLAHTIAIIVAAIQIGGLHRINILTESDKIPAGFGFALPGVYLTWITVVAIMYFPCKWFADLKGRRSDWWLSYL